MGTAIVVNGEIKTPRFGRLNMLKIVASDSGVRPTASPVLGSLTDSFAGGVPAKWVGSAWIAQHTPGGIQQLANGVASTVYIETKGILNVAVEFEIVEFPKMEPSGADFIIDLRRISGGPTNHCYRLYMRPYNVLGLARRSIEDPIGAPFYTMTMPKQGNLIRLKIVDSRLDLYVDGEHVYGFVDPTPLMQAGQIALSKGGDNDGSTSGFGLIKNLKIYEVED